MSATKNQLVQYYTTQLAAHPLRTKSATAGVLSFLQEILAAHIAGVPFRTSKDAGPPSHLLAAAKVDARAFKMALYGALVSAPLGHVLVGQLQRAFAGRTGTGARVAQVIASNLVVAPIQTAVYLASMAIVGGAKTVDEIKKTVKAGFMTVLKVTWMTSPVATVIAQRYIPPELWVPFFNLVTFVLGTYFNAKVKSLKLRAAKENEDKKDKHVARDI